MNGKVRALVGATGVSAVVAAVALSGGTSAFYYDSAHFQNNSIQACGFALDVKATTSKLATTIDNTASNTPNTATVDTDADRTAPGHAIQITGLEPGDAFKTTFNIKNNARDVANCDGDVWTDISAHDPSVYNGDAQHPGTLPGDLDRALKVNVQIVRDGTTSDFLSGTYAEVARALPGKIADALHSNESMQLIATYGVPLGERSDYGQNGAADNSADIRTKTLTFNWDFGLVQVGQNPRGANGAL